MQPAEKVVGTVRGIVDEHVHRGSITSALVWIRERETMTQALHTFDKQGRHC